MKKIAFMFAAAALFVACGGTTEKPATEEETVVEETVVEEVAVVDSAAVWAKVLETCDTTGMEADTLTAKFEAAKAELEATCCKGEEGECCQKEGEEETTEE